MSYTNWPPPNYEFEPNKFGRVQLLKQLSLRALTEMHIPVDGAKKKIMRVVGDERSSFSGHVSGTIKKGGQIIPTYFGGLTLSKIFDNEAHSVFGTQTFDVFWGETIEATRLKCTSPRETFPITLISELSDDQVRFITDQLYPSLSYAMNAGTRQA